MTNLNNIYLKFHRFTYKLSYHLQKQAMLKHRRPPTPPGVRQRSPRSVRSVASSSRCRAQALEQELAAMREQLHSEQQRRLEAEGHASNVSQQLRVVETVVQNERLDTQQRMCAASQGGHPAHCAGPGHCTARVIA